MPRFLVGIDLGTTNTALAYVDLAARVKGSDGPKLHTFRIPQLAAPAEVATVLHVKSGTPLLRVDRVSSTYDGEPVEFRRGWCLTERHHYYNELG